MIIVILTAVKFSGFDFNFSNIGDSEQLPMYLLAICMSSFENDGLKIWQSMVYTYFSHFIGCIFILLFVYCSEAFQKKI